MCAFVGLLLEDFACSVAGGAFCLREPAGLAQRVIAWTVREAVEVDLVIALAGNGDDFASEKGADLSDRAVRARDCEVLRLRVILELDHREF